MHLKKIKFPSSHRRPETLFRQVQGHQQAVALTGPFNISQSTFFTVYEVEHRKTINTKFGKQTISFSEVTKEFSQYFRENTKMEESEIYKVTLHSFAKAY